MRVQTEEWRRFIPGVRMYKGKMTLFYNGEILSGDGENLIYTDEERLKWEVIIVLPGVEIIPEYTFLGCENVKVVIMADTVRRIEKEAFCRCMSLEFVKLSRNLEYIGYISFSHCKSLISIFIPPSCREIGREAFRDCKKLIIFTVPRHTTLGNKLIANTALFEASPYDSDQNGFYFNIEGVNQWIKNINGNNEEYALHRACSAFNPISDIIYEIIKRQGLVSFQKKNIVGITPLRYLEENPFADIDQQKLVKRYILEMMGETV